MLLKIALYTREKRTTTFVITTTPTTRVVTIVSINMRVRDDDVREVDARIKLGQRERTTWIRHSELSGDSVRGNIRSMSSGKGRDLFGERRRLGFSHDCDPDPDRLNADTGVVPFRRFFGVHLPPQ